MWTSIPRGLLVEVSSSLIIPCSPVAQHHVNLGPTLKNLADGPLAKGHSVYFSLFAGK